MDFIFVSMYIIIGNMTGLSLFNGLSGSIGGARKNYRGTGKLLDFFEWDNSKIIDTCYSWRNPCSTDSYR